METELNKNEKLSTISNPLESSTNIDNMISQHDNMIDSIIDNLEKSSDSKKDKYKLN
jgi:hypothetical protein